MKLNTKPYLEQKANWVQNGRVILAQYDTESIIVYQAYRPSIGHFAASKGYFGGDFKLSRMTWIKPNFLWMMYRSGWGAKEGQEVVLAIRLKRSAFDYILAAAVHSTYTPEIYDSKESWQKAVAKSDVRLQWDPDRSPGGGKLQRRAIQLGLRGDAIKKYAQEWIVDIEDISEFVAEQRQHVITQNYDALLTPTEHIYEVKDREIARKLQLTTN
ncbi:conserved hypothetical protein [Hyella patelloides LEGE 07179]|uniref:DUF4291 domain-containing protein n=1 Tax=Hyella patelloides LEGE 07179 TaxID=945734 RepID=A0A563W4C2_9CYAN|nr:DUF4291 domain-containing protein [Hyella patelloides]VEP18541.1 conserved hypothetical protein [Hyella patelloides LEGE 07179]